MAMAGQKTFLQIQAELGEKIVGTATGSSPYFDAYTRPTLTRVQQIINDAYRELCSQQDWWFLFRQSTFSTVVGQTTAYAVDVNAEMVTNMAIEARQQKLNWMEFGDWRTIYPGGYQNMGNMLPTFYIPSPPDPVTSGLQYFLGPGPCDQIYTVKYGMKLRVSDMTASGDYPLVPAQWQDVLIWKAEAKIWNWLGDVNREQVALARYQDRFNAMYMEDQTTEESSWRQKDSISMMAYSPYTDVNRALFVPFGGA